MSDCVLLLLCAAHSFGFAVFHLGFWKLFAWREELPRMSVANRAILQIANLRLIYVFLGVGALEQFMFLPYHRLVIHALSALFALGVVVFAWPALR